MLILVCWRGWDVAGVVLGIVARGYCKEKKERKKACDAAAIYG
jgi:hypothetical protein